MTGKEGERGDKTQQCTTPSAKDSAFQYMRHEFYQVSYRTPLEGQL